MAYSKYGSDVDWLRHEILIIGQQMANLLDHPEEYEPGAHSDGVDKYLCIYHKPSFDPVLTIQAPTYYDLHKAVEGAWHAVTLTRRGF